VIGADLAYLNPLPFHPQPFLLPSTTTQQLLDIHHLHLPLPTTTTIQHTLILLQASALPFPRPPRQYIRTSTLLQARIQNQKSTLLTLYTARVSLPIPLPTHPASPWAALRTASLPSSSTSVSPTRAPLQAELLPPASRCPRLRQPTSPSAVCSTRRVLMAPTTAAPASSPRHLALAPAHLHPVWHLPSPLLRARLLPRPHCAPPHRRHLLLLAVSHVPCLPSTRTLTYPLKAGMS
jgi:hypothetical protein